MPFNYGMPMSTDEHVRLVSCTGAPRQAVGGFGDHRKAKVFQQLSIPANYCRDRQPAARASATSVVPAGNGSRISSFVPSPGAVAIVTTP